MKELPPPQDEHGKAYMAAEVFDLCIATVKNTNLKVRLRCVRGSVESAALDYEAAAKTAELHLIAHSDNVLHVTKDELQQVYVRMTQANTLGRDVYDRIMSAAVNECCPLCGLGQVKTLDHHLPKSLYSLLCVTPNNLVPSCRDCQSEKRSDYPKTKGEQTLHPYFDRFQHTVWLKAEVSAGQPAAFKFLVDDKAQYDPIILERLKHHMETFGLAKRFAVQSADELQNMKRSLQRLHELGGMEAVRADLIDRAAGCEYICRNSWRSAMHRAGASSDWFCDRGFSL